ncbi:addiction module antitoxin RelB [Marinobacter salinus]|uniref:Addiction module antitoxin RelB n=1 Tax=Marinobacter salinus TaxID=1874317 RepID=A0A1D9GLH2_9GAMM|nr:addiction module protein [Marinobacter salinus]AOY88355.1 addiction module antitoxin RelB [Marinobacter salinus]
MTEAVITSRVRRTWTSPGALHLSKEDQGQLIQQLVLNLESPSEEELRSDWLPEARRRGKELDDGTVQAVSGKDVTRKARALIK